MTNLIDMQLAKAEIEGRLGRHPARGTRPNSSLEVIRRTLQRSRREELHQAARD